MPRPAHGPAHRSWVPLSPATRARPGSYGRGVPDTATDPAGPHPLTAPARLGAFLALLALVAGVGWGVGRVANPPLPVPDLPTPSVFGPAGHGAGEGH